MSDFLPLSRDEMEARGWDQLDFIMVSGDAYVDHPSFGAALVCRLLESRGYRVGLICQPDWKKPEAFKVLGKPRLAFLVSGGNMDSMVLHYTAAKKRRSDDSFSPGKAAGLRPDRATIVYSAALRQAWKNVPLIIGGLEVSLRRLGHYDYWSDKVRRSILLDSKADLAVWGMGERAILEIARRLDAGESPAEMRDIRGTLYKVTSRQQLNSPETSQEGTPDATPEDSMFPPGTITLPAFEAIQADKSSYARSFGIQNRNTDPFSAKPLAEGYASGEMVVQMPPALPLDQKLFDEIHELPYRRLPHPRYQVAGAPGQGIAALEEVQFSLISSRGCFGACSFCALTFHQGRLITARSRESLVREARILTQHPNFKGYIHDVGGPTANFRVPACEKMAKSGSCTDRSCLGSDPCKNLKADHRDYLAVLREIRQLPGVKKVFVRSGIRFDYLLEDPSPDFFRELVTHHISGQLKVAPEHVSPRVLRAMGKPSIKVYQDFKVRYESWNQKLGKKQFLVPYFISSHPGSRLEDAIELALFLRDQGVQPQQVQDFYPTPGTVSTCMWWTGLDPRTLQPIETVRSPHEKALQRALLQFRDPKNHKLVREALLKAGREDLIGRGPRFLVPPEGVPGFKRPGPPPGPVKTARQKPSRTQRRR